MNRVGSFLLLSYLIVEDTSNGQEKPRRGFLSVLHEGHSSRMCLEPKPEFI